MTGSCVKYTLKNYVIKPCKWEQKDKSSLHNGLHNYDVVLLHGENGNCFRGLECIFFIKQNLGTSMEKKTILEGFNFSLHIRKIFCSK